MDKPEKTEKVSLGRNVKRLWLILKTDPISGRDIEVLKPIMRRAFFWLMLTEVVWLIEAYPQSKLFVELITVPGNHELFGLRPDHLVWLLAVGIYLFAELGSKIHYKQDVAVTSADWLFYFMINDFGTRKQLGLGADFHVETGAGGKESILGKNQKNIMKLQGYLAYSILPLTVRISLTTVTVFVMVWQLGVLAIVTIGIWLAAYITIEPKLNRLREKARAQTKQIERDDSELSSLAITIREQGLEDELSADHREIVMGHWRDEIPRTEKFWHYLLWEFRPVNISRGLFVLVGFWCHRAGVPLGTLVLTGVWMNQIYTNLWRYSEFQHVLNEGLVALDELVGLFETEPSIKQPFNPKMPSQPRGLIEFEDVWFSYSDSTEAALKGISLKIEPGMTVALVGLSGCGKSTVAKLLNHLHDPGRGRILVDGVDLREIDDKRYRRELVGTVPQESGLFNKSIERNIGLAKPGALFEQIRAAAMEAGADDFINQTADGYATMIGEGGIRLSGGQRQRLAISRALLRRPKILILDEPTSSLDAISQQWVKQTLEEWTAKRQSTILIIAHRFSTIEKADLVVVMKEGQIDGIGTHAELAKHNGLYNELRQLEGLLD